MALVHDLAVIGAGLFGSSCAKYASSQCHSVVLIGPSEEGKNHDIFGAWLDEGRIADLVDSTYIWRTLGKSYNLSFCNLKKINILDSKIAKQSLQSFKTIESASGDLRF